MLDQDGFQSAAVHDVKFLETFPDRSYKSNLIPIMRKNNFEGESTCQGFYTYNDKGEASPNPEISKYIEVARSMSSITIKLKGRHNILVSVCWLQVYLFKTGRMVEGAWGVFQALCILS